MPDGGQDYPEKILRESKRNLRVWLQDGAEDQENERYGSWPLANVRMANALKLKGYDFHFSFGKGTHNSGPGRSRISRGDDLALEGLRPGKTTQAYEMEPSEKSKPVFRVSVTNRDAE